MAAFPMVSSRRTAIWFFILLLAVLAFLRSLAPEQTETAIRHLIAKRNQVQQEIEEREKKIREEKDELEREKVALERWKIELDDRRHKLDEEEEESYSKTSERPTTDDDVEQKSSTPIEVTDGGGELHNKVEFERQGNDDVPEQHDLIGEDEEKVGELFPSDMADAPAPSLTSEECPTIVAPEHTKGGLGTQIEHIWTSLSLTLAIRNACMVIPPVLADDGTGQYKPIPFYQVFDTEELAFTGLRFVPLRTCQEHGVATIFDDAGKESAIVKNFAQYVRESHPKLARESTLVHGDSRGVRFLDDGDVLGDPNVVAKHVRDNLPEEMGRHCVGFGRMRAKVEINRDVLMFFRPAAEISDFVDSKFPLANETLFVKLRWNMAHCDKARREDGAMCIYGNQTVPAEEYVHAIAHMAKVSGASSIYLASPPHIPEDISAYIALHLITLDPIILDVDGDSFTAGIVEHELAIRAMRFVADGGNWCDTVAQSKKVQYRDLYVEGLDSMTMVQQWRDAGWPKDSSFVKGFEYDSNKGTIADEGSAEGQDPTVDDSQVDGNEPAEREGFAGEEEKVPVVVEEPAAVGEPAVVDDSQVDGNEPVIREGFEGEEGEVPVVVEEPAAVGEPAVASEGFAAIEESLLGEESAVNGEYRENDGPVVGEAPVAYEEPIVHNQPASFEQPGLGGQPEATTLSTKPDNDAEALEAQVNHDPESRVAAAENREEEIEVVTQPEVYDAASHDDDNRPAAYVPPDSYVPSNVDDDDLEILKQAGAQLAERN